MTAISKRFPGHARARRRRPRASRRARSTGCSARTARASRRCSRSSPATTGRAPARSRSTASRSRSTTRAPRASSGIGIVYQELSLLPNLSVAHNISLGSEPTHALRIDEHALRATAADVARTHGRALDRPGPHGLRAVARRAPARRDREGADAAPPARADLRRAHDGAQPPRRRAPLRDHARRCATTASAWSSSATAIARCSRSATPRPCCATGASSDASRAARRRSSGWSSSRWARRPRRPSAATGARRPTPSPCSRPAGCRVGGRVLGRRPAGAARARSSASAGCSGSGQDELARAICRRCARRQRRAAPARRRRRRRARRARRSARASR